MSDAKMTSPSGSFTTYTAAAAYSEATKAAAAAVAEVARERDGAREEVAYAKEPLERVAILGGGQNWTHRQMRAWACEVKDFRAGFSVEWCRRPHDKCRHEEFRDDADEPVTTQAEARVAELEALLGALWSEICSVFAYVPERQMCARVSAALAPQAPPARKEGE